jgi:hypothetical protein
MVGKTEVEVVVLENTIEGEEVSKGRKELAKEVRRSGIEVV